MEPNLVKIINDLTYRVEKLESQLKEMNRPSVLFRVKPQYIEVQSIWAATHEGKSGYGATPDAALESFDKIWNMKIERVENPNLRIGHVHMGQ